jgi:DNA-binding NarL/FixJ family response regulator
MIISRLNSRVNPFQKAKSLMTVLIIDDDPEDTSLFREALNELYPHAVCIIAHTCKNIQVSMKNIGEVDIIFIDGHMYPIPGNACLEQLIKIVDRSKTKLVVYSGGVSPTERLELEKIGADHILIKATSYDLLKSSIGEILASHF